MNRVTINDADDYDHQEEEELKNCEEMFHSFEDPGDLKFENEKKEILQLFY